MWCLNITNDIIQCVCVCVCVCVCAADGGHCSVLGVGSGEILEDASSRNNSRRLQQSEIPTQTLHDLTSDLWPLTPKPRHQYALQVINKKYHPFFREFQNSIFIFDKTVNLWLSCNYLMWSSEFFEGDANFAKHANVLQSTSWLLGFCHNNSKTH